MKVVQMYSKRDKKCYSVLKIRDFKWQGSQCDLKCGMVNRKGNYDLKEFKI